jgi:hypothetical protein
VPIRIHEVYTETTKAAYNKKENPILKNPPTLKNPIPQTQNLRETPALHHVSLVFPKPR